MELCWIIIMVTMLTKVIGYQYDYVGCYDYPVDMTQMSLKNNTPSICMQVCFSQFTYAGVKEESCYCGNIHVGKRVPEGSCTNNCPDERGSVFKCGGRSTISVYVRREYIVPVSVVYTSIIPLIVVMVNVVIGGALFYWHLKFRRTVQVLSTGMSETRVIDTEHFYEDLDKPSTSHEVTEEPSPINSVRGSNPLDSPNVSLYECEAPSSCEVDDGSYLRPTASIVLGSAEYETAASATVTQVETGDNSKIQNLIMRFDETRNIPAADEPKLDRQTRMESLKSQASVKSFKVRLGNSGNVKLVDRDATLLEGQGTGSCDNIEAYITFKCKQ